MVKKYLIAFAVICLMAAFAVNVYAGAKPKDEAEAKHEYVGAKKCSICHKKDNTYPSWLETKHAKAWDNLTEEQQKDESCVGCHSTGTTANGKFLGGVQCEACHGPGSDYWKKKIMEDRELAIKNGLLIPDEKTCLGCHKENLPEECKSKEKFDYEKMKATGIHALKAEAEAKTEKGK